MESITGLLEYGIVGGGFLFMLLQSSKREEKLMSFISEMKNEMVRMSEAYIRLAEDVEDIKQAIESTKE